MFKINNEKVKVPDIKFNIGDMCHIGKNSEYKVIRVELFKRRYSSHIGNYIMYHLSDTQHDNHGGLKISVSSDICGIGNKYFVGEKICFAHADYWITGVSFDGKDFLYSTNYGDDDTF